jgi:type I restriction-modification system DNA methylase subunit
MPTYPCEKCGRVFKQKSGYDDHMSKKTPCEQTSMIAAVIDAKVEEKVKAVVRAAMPKAEITKITDDTMKAFFEDLHNLLWNKAGLSPERALEHMTFFFAYRLIETQADVLALPQECRWSYLASHKNENDTYETMKKGCLAFQKNKVTKPFFKKPEIDKATIVYDIVQHISRISLTTMQETDTLGDIFEHMLGRGMSTMADEGQYFTNRKICKLAFKLAYDIKKTLRRADGSLCTFADWFCGTGGFPAEFVKGVNANDPLVNWKKDAGSLFCQDMNLSSVTTTLLNMLILTGIPFSGDTIRGSNSFTDAITMGAGAPFPGLTVDYCFMNPPYGGDKSKGREYKFAYSKTVKGDDGTSKKFFVNQEIQSIGVEDDDKVSAGVQLAMATLSEGGVCCIVLPQGFFFGASKKCVELRKKIAEDYKIWSIVDIASGSFLNTGTKTSMMVFQKGVGATETVSFIGLDERMLVEATLEGLRSKNYSLNYKQYLPQSAVNVDGFEMVKLDDILEKKSSGKTKVGDISNTGEYPFFSCKINNPCGTHSLYDHEETEYLLFAKSGGNSKQPTGDNLGIGRFYYMTERSASTSDVSKFVLKNKSINLKYVSIVLHTKLYQIQSLAKYTTGLGHIDIDQMFDEIQIPLPSLEKQQEIVEQIDFYTQMAHTEEQSLKILEKIVMGWVKEMGRGKERVKLGEVCEWQMGKRIVKDQVETGPIPVYGGGGITFYTNSSNRSGINCKISREGMSEANCVIMIHGDYHQNSQGMTVVSKDITKTINPYIWYWLVINKDKVYECGHGTAQKAISMAMLNDLQIPLPSLAEQQTLQSDFDEIRHKHAKIAEYKAKAQEAIQRLIPGAKKETEKVITNQIIVPITMSHTSTCEVDTHDNGCTCRLPLPIEKEEEHTIASTVSASVITATAAVKRRKLKIAPKINVE